MKSSCCNFHHIQINIIDKVDMAFNIFKNACYITSKMLSMVETDCEKPAFSHLRLTHDYYAFYYEQEKLCCALVA